MSNDKQVMRIDSIHAERGEIVLSGQIFKLGERIQLKYYRVGNWEECDIRDGTVVFMKKADPPAQSSQQANNSQIGGFTSADQYAPQSSQKKQQRDSSPGMVWCNAMTNAIEILKIRVGDASYSELQEIDLSVIALADAAKIYEAGMRHVKADQNV